MKYTVIGDPHTMPKNVHLSKQVTERAESLGNPCIWLGDMLDTKEVIRGKCLNFWFDYFRGSNLNHTVLVGNHDWFNLECQEHSLQTLKGLPNVNVVDSLQETHGDTFSVAYIPYMHDQKELKKVLKAVPDGATLFGHLELKGFDFGNGYMCEEGLTQRTFSRFKNVITGHFHKYQKTGNITYLGTPYSLNFGETNQTKYIGIYDSDTQEMELLKTNLSQHYTLDVDAIGAIPEMDPKHNYRINLIGTQSEIELFDRSPLLELGCKIVAKPTDAKKLDVVIDENASNLDQFKTWANDISELTPDVIQLGIKILGECDAK